MTTVRVLLALASIHNWHIHQTDVNTTFLHGDMLEEVYMKLRPGLYTQSKADYYLFTKSNFNSFTTILVYVDDLLIAGNDMKEIDQLKSLINKEFNIKDLGELKYFLGMEVARSKAGMNLCQRKYALDLLHDTGLLGAKPSTTPMDSVVKLYSQSGTQLSDASKYRRLVGRLIYLTHTRPDIAYSVGHLSQFLAKPTNTHYEAALRVVRYLKNAPGKGLLFPSQNDTFLVLVTLTGVPALTQEDPSLSFASSLESL
ncbi:PREDICTED: uncharacterized protein LOC109327630 [Lupinus angustifolius]|uniref:uncharacterized protein LOC109327630 n=1 Tax=Lupinus angustifolius TaxID=3871 RepID=UPI00092E59A9|nr:PREDICTED: uncharacterized protein LOC109327630 [Lupinus angustifolius]